MNRVAITSRHLEIGWTFRRTSSVSRAHCTVVFFFRQRSSEHFLTDSDDSPRIAKRRKAILIIAIFFTFLRNYFSGRYKNRFKGATLHLCCWGVSLVRFLCATREQVLCISLLMKIIKRASLFELTKTEIHIQKELIFQLCPFDSLFKASLFDLNWLIRVSLKKRRWNFCSCHLLFSTEIHCCCYISHHEKEIKSSLIYR